MGNWGRTKYNTGGQAPLDVASATNINLASQTGAMRVSGTTDIATLATHRKMHGRTLSIEAAGSFSLVTASGSTTDGEIDVGAVDLPMIPDDLTTLRQNEDGVWNRDNGTPPAP